MRRAMLCVLLGLFSAAVGCGDGSLDPLPLGITLQASRTIAEPDEPITFRADAQGGSLLGVSIDYGDDSVEQRGTGGARTATVTFSHAFSTPGVYQVRATVTDAIAGNQDAAVQITIMIP